MAKAELTINVEKWPEALAAMRSALARALREAAEDEEERVARRLREIAAAFEAGQKGADDGA